jgi:hypothetical protein
LPASATSAWRSRGNCWAGGKDAFRHGRDHSAHNRDGVHADRAGGRQQAATAYHHRHNITRPGAERDARANLAGLELHSNPRDPEQNQWSSFYPIFTRAVLFETNEHSWHGFPRIQLPEIRAPSVAEINTMIYLYTRERPAEEIAPLHGTFYVERPLPASVRPGHVLNLDGCQPVRHAAERRDKWIENYQRMELAKRGPVADHAAYIRELLSRVRAPSPAT